MSDSSHPVTVLVQRPDGSKEAVRVGTAVRVGDTFQLRLGELTIGATPDRASAAPSAPRPAAPRSGGDASGMVFPPYGRSKGAPIAGASIGDLEYYIQGSKRSLDDPSKARFHDKERVLLAAMEAELARQRGGGGGGASTGGAGGASTGGGSAPRGGRGGGKATFSDADEPPLDDRHAPAFDDDDIPF